MLTAAAWAVHLLAWVWISDDSEGSSASSQLFADLKICCTVVVNQDSERCAELGPKAASVSPQSQYVKAVNWFPRVGFPRVGFVWGTHKQLAAKQ